MFQEFSKRIHRHGMAVTCPISHMGRCGDAQAGESLPTIAPSAVREELHRNFPREMERHDIDRVAKAFGQAARRCQKGGLEGLETLAGGHLIGQFFSPRPNLRRDDFGASIKNRTRFALIMHEQIRRQVGDDFVVGMRLPHPTKARASCPLSRLRGSRTSRGPRARSFSSTARSAARTPKSPWSRKPYPA